MSSVWPCRNILPTRTCSQRLRLTNRATRAAAYRRAGTAMPTVLQRSDVASVKQSKVRCCCQCLRYSRKPKLLTLVVRKYFASGATRSENNNPAQKERNIAPPVIHVSHLSPPALFFHSNQCLIAISSSTLHHMLHDSRATASTLNHKLTFPAKARPRALPREPRRPGWAAGATLARATARSPPQSTSRHERIHARRKCEAHASVLHIGLQ